jgi:hypothetical protein
MFRKKKNRAKRSALLSCVQVAVGRGKEAGWNDDTDEESKRERTSGTEWRRAGGKGGEKKERRALSHRAVGNFVRARGITARGIGQRERGWRLGPSGTTNLTIPSTLRRRSRRPYYNAAQAGFGSPLGDTRASFARVLHERHPRHYVIKASNKLLLLLP